MHSPCGNLYHGIKSDDQRCPQGTTDIQQNVFSMWRLSKTLSLSIIIPTQILNKNRTKQQNVTIAIYVENVLNKSELSPNPIKQPFHCIYCSLKFTEDTQLNERLVSNHNSKGQWDMWQNVLRIKHTHKTSTTTHCTAPKSNIKSLEMVQRRAARIWELSQTG